MPLPIQQVRCGFVPIQGKFGQGGTAGDEGRVDAQFGGDGVSPGLQLQEASTLILGGAAGSEPERFGVLVGWQRQRGFDSLGERSAAASGVMPGEEVLESGTLGGEFRDTEDQVVAEDEERRPVCRDRFGFAPGPDFAQDGEGRTTEAIAALEPPNHFRLRAFLAGGIEDQALATLRLPVQAAGADQFGAETVREFFEVMSVVACIPFHPGIQRPDGPVGFLWSLFEFYPKKALDQVGESELAQADEAGCEHRVEDGFGLEGVVLAEQTQVVIGAVHEQLVPGQGAEERHQVDGGQGVHEAVAIGGADLEQTEFFRVGVQAVSLGIDRHPGGGREDRQELLERFRRVNHGGNIVGWDEGGY